MGNSQQKVKDRLREKLPPNAFQQIEESCK